MKRHLFMLLSLVALAAVGSAQDLRARWGGTHGEIMRVVGVDARGRVRLVAENGAAGEVLVPLPDARGLRFELPADYQRGRQLALDGRSGEAILLLRRMVPALVPYAQIPESNAQVAVRFYFRVLLQERVWADALALALAVNPEHAGRKLADEWAALGRGLLAEHRWEELGLLVDRWWVGPPDSGVIDNRRAVESLATTLREQGQWREAAVLYQKLREGTAGERRQHYDLLLAYLDWHQGSDLSAQAIVRLEDAPDVATDTGALWRLLRARLLLQSGESRAALDVLAEALVGAGSASEWRIETIAVLADAYQKNGDEETALRIGADLRRQHPDSRWATHADGEQTL